jgi:hypothetical protein
VRRHEREHPSNENTKAYIDASVAAVKASLELTPEQERHWAGLEQALREVTETRLERSEALHERNAPEDPLETMRDQADELSERAGALRKLATGIEPLYRTLSDQQKRRLFRVMQIAPVRLRHRHRRRWR